MLYAIEDKFRRLHADDRHHVRDLRSQLMVDDLRQFFEAAAVRTAPRRKLVKRPATLSSACYCNRRATEFRKRQMEILNFTDCRNARLIGALRTSAPFRVHAAYLDKVYQANDSGPVTGTVSRRSATRMGAGKKTVLAVGSAGLYWDDLMLLAPTLGQSDTRYASTSIQGPIPRGAISVDLLPDCRLSQPFGFLACLIAAFRLVRKHRPDVVVSTGAAPGLACILAARALGARTLWIDGLVHNEKVSSCGSIARFVAHGCWTQWVHLADGKRIRYYGSTM